MHYSPSRRGRVVVGVMGDWCVAEGRVDSPLLWWATAAGKNIDVYNSISHHGNPDDIGWRAGRVGWDGRGSCGGMAESEGHGFKYGRWVVVNGSTAATATIPNSSVESVDGSPAVRQTCPIVLYLLIRLAVASSRTRRTAIARNLHALTP